jgi:hypothetical protein
VYRSRFGRSITYTYLRSTVRALASVRCTRLGSCIAWFEYDLGLEDQESIVCSIFPIGCCNIACQNPSPSEARIPAPSAGAIKISMASSPGPSESQHRTPVATTTTAISITIDWFARFPCRCSIPGAARHPQLKQEARCDDGGGQTLPVLGRPACSQSFWVLCSGAFPP